MHRRRHDQASRRSRILERLRVNTTPMPFRAVADHYYDEDINVEKLLLVDPPYDLAEITADVLLAEPDERERLCRKMMLDGVVKVIVSDPTSEFIDDWPFYLGTYDIAGDREVLALYVHAIYLLKFA